MNQGCVNLQDVPKRVWIKKLKFAKLLGPLEAQWLYSNPWRGEDLVRSVIDGYNAGMLRRGPAGGIGTALNW